MYLLDARCEDVGCGYGCNYLDYEKQWWLGIILICLRIITLVGTNYFNSNLHKTLGAMWESIG